MHIVREPQPSFVFNFQQIYLAAYREPLTDVYAGDVILPPPTESAGSNELDGSLRAISVHFMDQDSKLLVSYHMHGVVYVLDP